MNLTLYPAQLKGSVTAPPSKSHAHRLLFAAALADAPTKVLLTTFSDDLDATMRCLQALGAEISIDREGIVIRPLRPAGNTLLDCGESGTTLRLLLPIAASLGGNHTFTGSGRLPHRPVAELLRVLSANGISFSQPQLPFVMKGKLSGGTFSLPGDVSSQYISGLLLALPKLLADSRICLTSPLQSRPYVALTLQVLRQFGIQAEAASDGFFVPGNQRYHTPGVCAVEDDWSSAACWYAADAMGANITVQGLPDVTAQGDQVIQDLLAKLGGDIDVSQTPDLFPLLAIAAACHPGTTRLTGAARLRLKESDRLDGSAHMLQDLGVKATQAEDSLTIHGQESLNGGVVDCRNDHRLVMAAAIAVTRCKAPVTLLNAEAVRKSYPAFFTDYELLGGRTHG